VVLEWLQEQSGPFGQRRRGRADGREDSLDNSPARRESIKLRVIHGEGLGELQQAIQRAIAYRAYEVYSQRGHGHGHDLEDWFHAEGDLVKPEDVQVSEAGGQWIVRAGTRGFGAGELQVGASPRKIIIWGQAARPSSARAQSPQQLLGEIELPSAGIPENSSATLNGDSLEVRVAKE
jgi:HSP20 family molecular chaperone IbpA